MFNTTPKHQMLPGIIGALAILILFCLTGSTAYAQDTYVEDQTPLPADMVTSASHLPHVGTSPFDPAIHNDTTFVVDSSPGLDTGCTYRNGGPLLFDIHVNRFIGDRDKLLANGLLGTTANLRMPAYDVDFAGAPGYNPERDRVFFNGNIVPTEFLDGQNNTWILNNFQIPMDWINFPVDPGDGGTLTPAVNTIQIDIDTANFPNQAWCTAIDWAALSIDVVRPILMVHGIFSNGGTWDQANSFQWSPALSALGVPTATISMHTFPSVGLDSIEDNAGDIATKVDELKLRWGVDRLNVVAHSKGGLDSRHYIEANPTVERLVQLGTPNAGSPAADLAQKIAVRFVGVVNTAIINGLAAPAGVQLTTKHMKNYNQSHSYNQNTTYVSLAGDYRFGGLGIIDALFAGFYGGPSDTIVPVSSVHALTYTTNLTHPSTGSDTSARHTSLTKSKSVYDRVLPFIKTLGQVTPPAVAAVAYAAQSQNSTATVQSYTIADTIVQGETKTHSLFVDGAQPVSFMLQHDSGDLNLTLISPSGRRIDSAVAATDPDLEFEHINDGQGLLFAIYGVQNPEVGQWTLEVLAATVGNPAGQEPYGLIGIFTGSPIQMQATVDKPAYRKGQPILVQAVLTDNGTPLTGASATAKMVLPDESTQQLTLLDDGTGGDTTANDGTYTGRFNSATLPGLYRLLVSVSKSASPAFNRDELLLAFVSDSNSAFNGTFSDFGNDLDGDGLFDELVVNVGVNISALATYRILGELADSNGALITTAFTETTLITGSQVVALRFDGTQIFQHGVDGPYTLRTIRLAENNGFTVLPLEERQNAYTTTNYRYTQFQGAPVTIPGTGTDQGIDTNANGLFDLLEIKLDVLLRNAGSYNWSARLADSNGVELGVLAASGQLNGGNNTITFQFDGAAIGQNGVDGPYFLNDLLIFSSQDSAVVFHAYTTAVYTASQFEGYRATLPADLSLAKTANPNPATVGQTLTYSLTVLNKGSNDATGVTLTDELPAEVTFVSATSGQGSCAEAGRIITCTLGTLLNGASTTATITVTPNSGATIINTAHVTGNESDPDTTNNSASATTTVKPALTGSKLYVDPQPLTIPLAEQRTFAIQIDPGSSPVNGVQVHGKVDPAVLRLVGAQASGRLPQELAPASFDASTGEFTYAAGALGAVFTQTFTVMTVTVEALTLTVPAGSPIRFVSDFPPTDISGPTGSVLDEAVDGTAFVESGAVTLKVAMNLQGRPAFGHASWSVPLAVDIFAPGATVPTNSFSVTTNLSGTFTLNNLTPGTFDLRIKHAHSISKRLTNVPLRVGENTIPFGHLREGDVQPNNQIVIADFGPLSAAFNSCRNQPRFAANADLNEDGCILIDDLGLFSGNFNRQGDELVCWGCPTTLPIYPATARLDFGQVETTTVAGLLTALPIYIDPVATSVNGATVHLAFDPAVVEVVSVEISQKFSLHLGEPTIDNQAGRVHFSAATGLGASENERFVAAVLQVRLRTVTSGTTISPVSNETPVTAISSPGGNVLDQASGITLRATEGTARAIFLPLVAR